MSSDNGIYILKTRAREPQIDSDFEYRVAHGQAIENIYWDQEEGEYREDGRFTPEIAFEYFGEAPVFRTEVEALQFAAKEAEEYDILEYGICSLDHRDQVFEIFTKTEADKFEQRGDELIEERRRELQQQIAEDLEERTVVLPKNTHVTVGGWIKFVDPEDSSDNPRWVRGLLRRGTVVLLVDDDVQVLRLRNE